MKTYTDTQRLDFLIENEAQIVKYTAQFITSQYRVEVPAMYGETMCYCHDLEYHGTAREAIDAALTQRDKA